MSAQHTPGPWQQRDDQTTEGWITIIGNVDGEYIDGKPCCTYDVIARCEDEYGERLPNVSANARLIAAAPDLLAVCKAFLEIAENPAPRADDRKMQWLSVAMNARTAITKATGQ